MDEDESKSLFALFARYW